MRPRATTIVFGLGFFGFFFFAAAEAVDRAP
jgi:hypothetical protein